MRASVASISKKIISTFFAATLVFGLMPVAAFAESAGDAAASQSSESANADSDIQAEAEVSAYGDDLEENDGSDDSSQHVISSEGDEVPNPHVISTEGPEDPSGEISSPGDGDDVALPAGDMINQEMELDTVVAQAESTRSFFLAQTLESTRTVPVVSAKLPLDTGATDGTDAPAEDGALSSEGEGSSNFDGVSGSDDPVDPSFTLGSSEGDSAAVSAESTVIGSFAYLGMTFAIEPGGESVALMAVDYSKLPEEYVQKQVLVIPDTATPDGIDYYSVTRIADDAFAGLNKDNANPDYVGCEALFSDEELLAEAGIDPSEVAEFLSDDGAAAAAQDGESANADSDIQAQAEACAYEDQATAEPAEGDGAAPQVISGEVSLSDDPSQHVISSDKDEASPTNVISNEGAEADPNPHVISSGVSGANGVEKSRPSDEDGGEASADSDNDIRTIVSMDGNVATLDDGSTYTFKNSLAGCAGILALGIPASITTIEDDALSGFSTLQYVVVSEDNTSYASYDGALYSADLTNLRLIPEGRVGAVRVAPSATGVDPEVFSHCPSVDALVADAEGESSINKLGNAIGSVAILKTDIRYILASNDLMEVLESCAFACHITQNASSGSGLDLGARVLQNASYSYPVIGKYGPYSGKLLRPSYSSVRRLSYTHPQSWDYRHCSAHVDLTSIESTYGAVYLDTSNLYVYICNRGHVHIGYGTTMYSYIFEGMEHCGGWYSGGGNFETTNSFSGLTFEEAKFLENARVTWDAASYGAKIDNGGTWSDTMTQELTTELAASQQWLLDSLPDSSKLFAPAGFAFKGWATQAKDDAGNLLTDEFGNRVLNTEYTRYDPATNTTFTETCEGGTYLTEANGTNLVIEEDTTFYAVFAIDATFDASTYGGSFEDGSTTNRTQEVVYGNKVAVPAVEPKGEGWTFKGWATRQDDGSGNLVTDALGNPLLNAYSNEVITVTKDNKGYQSPEEKARDPEVVHYYAVWEVDLSWQRMEGAVEGMTIDGEGATPVVYGTKVAAPATSSPESHYFLKWTAESNPEGQRDSEVEGGIHYLTVLAPGSIVAKWAPNIYKVAFKDKDDADRTDNGTGSLFMKYGDGWYTDAACTDASKVNATLAGGWVKAPARAGFTCIGYSRSSTATTPEFFYTGTSAADYAFSESDHAAGNDIFDDATSSGDTVTVDGRTCRVGYLYPVWKAIATWVFDDDGVTASVSEPKTVDNGNPTVTCKDQGVRPGYTPAGWKVEYTNGETDDTTYTTGQTITLKGDATITAQWTPVLYDITMNLGATDYDGEVFRNDGGNAGLVGTVSMSGSGEAKGTAVKATSRYDVTNGSVTLPTFSRPGFSLLGWRVTAQPSGTGANGTLTDQVVADASGYAAYAFSTAPGDGQVRGAITFTAVWTAAVPYPITPQKKLDGVVAAGDYYDATVADIPATYTVSGTGKLANLVPKASPSGVAGYRFVGWSADKDGFLLDATTGDAIAADTVSDNVRIATGLVDWKPTLCAHFETIYYDLTVDLALPDATGAYSTSANWTKPDASQNVYAYKATKLESGATGGYSLYDASGIAIPTPSRAGQVFRGWQVQKLDDEGNPVSTDVAELSQSGSDWKLPVSLEKLGNYRLTAQWGASEYAIAFGNIEHVADKASGDFVSATNPVKAAYDATARTFEFTGDDLTPDGATESAIEVSAPDFDATRYTGFSGWYLPAGMVPSADRVNAWTRDDATGRYYLPALTISQKNLSALFSAKDESGAFVPLKLEAGFTMKDDHRATLNLDGGKFVTADPSWTKGADGTYSLAYSSTSSKRMLPAVSRYGYEFAGWVLTDAGTGSAVEELASVTPSGDGVKRLNVELTAPAAGDAEGYWINDDVVGDRIYTAQWWALSDRVEFDYNATQEMGSGSNGPAPQDISFGSVLPSGLSAPQREGYDFVGYFDTAASTGGVQYLTSTMTPARAWDKAPVYEDEAGTVIVPHVLYARWTPEPPAGTNPENEPKPGTITPAPPAAPDPSASTHAAFSAKKGEGSSEIPETGFSAFYNGFFARAIDDTVTVSLDSYVLADKADGTQLTAKDIYDAFERSGDAKPHLQGFMVDSTKSIIAFADIARGASFSFAFKVSDLQSDVADAASFSLDGLKLTALYTSMPYDFTDPEGGEPPSIEPEDGDEILAVFDANGGAFGSGDSATATACTTTEYRKDASEHVTLPVAPTRDGYAFKGWSLASTCADDADHAMNATNALFRIDDVLVKHYVAHWAEKTYKVHLYKNDGNASHLEADVVFGSTASLAELLSVDAYEPPSREGYLFLGYFDDEKAGTQYFASDGTSAKPFDKTVPEGTPDGYVSLYARWLALGGGSGEPGDIDPTDPFPPHDDVVIVPAAAPDNAIRMVARDGAGNPATMSLNGVYDGYYAHTSSSDDVAVSVCSYRAADVESSVRKIIERFEANNDVAVSGGAHLQGFRVESTGAFVSVVDLWNGAPFTLICKTTDLDAAHDPASAVFKAGAVSAVYGPTLPIAPDNPDAEWPEWGDPSDPASGTRVHNTFDARGGLFADSTRFKTVDSGLGLAVQQPNVQPSYDNVDPTYLFVGWFDAKGSPFDPAALQTTTAPTTYFAKYEHVEFTFVLHDVQDGVKDIHKTAIAGDGKTGEFSVYKGQELTDSKSNALGQALPPVSASFEANAPAARTGYDFIGWFYKEPGTGNLVPFYLTKAADDEYAAQYIQRMGWKVTSSYTNTSTSGWGDITGAARVGDEVDLYALWNVESYTIQWTYNWTEREYVYTEVDAAGGDLTRPAPVTVEYGQDIAGLIPSIKDPAYKFLGWYAGKTVTGNDERLVAFEPVSYTPGGHDPDTRTAAYADAKSGSREPSYFTYKDDVRRFEPANVEGIDARGRAFEFFACFADEATRYNYRIYFGRSADDVRGRIANVGTIAHDDALGMDYLSYSYMPAFETNLSDSVGSTTKLNHIVPAAGYSLSGFYRTPESTEAVPEPVTIPQWSTGLQVFYLGWNANSYHIRLTMSTLDLGEDALSSPPGTVMLNGTAAYDLDLSSDDGREIALPTPTGAVGYVFKGWKRCDEDGTIWKAGDAVPNGEITFDVDYVKDAFAGKSEGTAYYGAVWEPLAYDVRFHVQRETENGSDLFDSYTLMSEGTESAAHPSKLTLPYPHTLGVSNIFAYWSLETFDGTSACEAWTSGTELSLAEIFAMQKRLGLAEPTDGLADASAHGTIDIYAQWRGVVGADVPLEVNMLIDPYTPNEPAQGKVITNSEDSYRYGSDGTVVANGWVGTSSGNDVRIESLTFERGDAATFELMGGGDGGSALDLLVYGGGLGEEAGEPLRLNLGATSTVVPRDAGGIGSVGGAGGTGPYLVDYGLDGAIAKGSPLYLYYDLDIKTADGTLTSYERLMNELLDQTEASGSTVVRTSTPLARLYYTIGLVPSTLTGPTD